MTIQTFLKVLLIAAFLVLLPISNSSFAQTPTVTVKNGDANEDGEVNMLDLQIVFSNWLAALTSAVDQYPDGKINSFDFAVVDARIKAAMQPSPSTTSAPAVVGEWTQHAHDAQRTSYTSQTVPAPWRKKWIWNGPDSETLVSNGRGGQIQPISNKIALTNQMQHYPSATGLPRNVQPVTGGGRVYIAAGNRGIYALNASTGAQLWNTQPGGDINSTVAYDSDTQSVFAVSSNGNLYKLNASTGATIASFSSNVTVTQTSKFNRLPLPPLVLSDRVIFGMGPNVYAVQKSSTATPMATLWTYNTNGVVQTPAAYSTQTNRVIVVARNTVSGTPQLLVHAIDNTNGAQLWAKNPSPRTAGAQDFLYGDGSGDLGANQAEASNGWPVISEQNGIVLVKFRLNWNTLWTWSPWPTTNTAMRNNLNSQPNQRALFALNLSDGNSPFTINVGHGGFGDGDYTPMGPQPVVKRLPNGDEVAYMMIRGDNRPGADGRDDSKYGELILNTNTSGYQPGDVRFMEWNGFGNWARFGQGWQGGANMPTDEQPQLTMSGDYILGGHWMSGQAMEIQNRDASLGTYTAPIQTKPLPHIVVSTNSQTTANCTMNTGHYCSSNRLRQEGDIRDYAGPGFYLYYGAYGHPASGGGTPIYDQYWSEYAAWVASNNQLYFRSADGAIIAFESGDPLLGAKQLSSNVAGAFDKVKEVLAPKEIVMTEISENMDARVKITATIDRSINSQKAVYLRIEESRETLQVRILEKDWEAFSSSPELLYTPGMKITVTGDLSYYQGKPTIYVTSPDQITITQ